MSAKHHNLTLWKGTINKNDVEDKQNKIANSEQTRAVQSVIKNPAKQSEELFENS